jgi:hypothetical protein
MMPSLTHTIRRALPAAAALAALSAAPALAEHPKYFLAHTPTGGPPNAPAADPVISRDGRLNRYAAYTSAATDIVPGSGPYRNVFLVYRTGAFNTSATTQWKSGKTVIASKGRGGPANGDSWGATFDGYDYVHAGREITVKPKCLAFVSNASNLVAGDGNGHADVFVRRLGSGKLTRIATAGAAAEVALDGRCLRLAYVSGGTVYVKNANGRGKARRVSGPGGANSPEMSANGKITTFTRKGVVFVDRSGSTHKVGLGTQSTADEWGKSVAFTRPDGVYLANASGAAHARLLDPGATAPSMTAGGHFVFYVRGSIATSNVYKNFGTCPAGSIATQINGSPHGNYAAFSCSNGAVYMSYIGAK